MRVNRTAVLGLAALGFALSAGTAGATTRCANPTGTSPCLLLQAAIAASGPNDVVTVNAGTYTGAALAPDGYIHVDSGRDGLKINGAGVAIIDNEFGTGANLAQIYIDSNSVGVNNLTIRNGRGYGIQANNGRTGIVISNVKFYGQQGDCVHLNGGNNNSKVTLSTMRGCDDGIDFGASDTVTITGNKISFFEYGIYGYGDDILVQSNKIFTGGSYGIYLDSSSDGSKVLSNQITNPYSDGMYIYGDGVTVMSNQVTNTESTGMYISGDNVVVQSNIFTNTYSDGIDAYGSNMQIKSNTIKTSDGTGIYLSTGGTTGKSHNAVISGNKVTTYPGGDAIEAYYSNNIQVTSNILTNTNDGIYVDGGNHPTITSNSMTNLLSTGIYLDCYSQYDPAGGPCTGGNVQSNKITDVSSSSYGIELYTSSNGPSSATMNVVSNTVNHSGDDCFYLYGDLITATGNKGYDCGTAGLGNGFYLYGKSHTITGNQIFRAAEDGFYVVTNDTVTTSTLTGNTSDHAGEDGFDVHTSRVTLTGNKALSNNGSGFEFGSGFNNLSASANFATGNATGACISSTSTVTLGTNAWGTPDAPADCNQPSGYIGN